MLLEKLGLLPADAAAQKQKLDDIMFEMDAGKNQSTFANNQCSCLSSGTWFTFEILRVQTARETSSSRSSCGGGRSPARRCVCI
jgi:hypothetical protein